MYRYFFYDMYRPVTLAYALALTACTIGASPEPETLPTPPPAQTVFLSSPVECVDVIQINSIVDTPTPTLPPPKPPLKRGKQAPRTSDAFTLDPTPTQVVSDGQKAARVLPTAQGFFGGSAEYTYAWSPGKVYTILLSPTQPTGIFLPPGERMVAGLLLNGEQYEVKTERAGVELTAYDAITIRPTSDKGDIDTFILTESGRRYLLHLVTGKTGMLAVTFEHPSIMQAQEPRLVLPRPQP